MPSERITTDTEARRNLESLMDGVVKATMETLHLLRSPRNAERLRDAIADVEAGNVVHTDFVDGEIAER